MPFHTAIPVLSISSVAHARSFYVEHLGMRWDWERRAGPLAPAYAQVSRELCVLHLNEDASQGRPGATVVLPVDHAQTLHDELVRQRGAVGVSPLQRADGRDEFWVSDPFGNRLHFVQSAPVAAAAPAPLTRAQVREEYLRARAAGTLPPMGEVG